jgi:hypothetical protein
MKTLKTHETNYLGDWNVQGTQVEADKTCKRIKWLVAEKLIEITAEE